MAQPNWKVPNIPIADKILFPSLCLWGQALCGLMTFFINTALNNSVSSLWIHYTTVDDDELIQITETLFMDRAHIWDWNKTTRTIKIWNVFLAVKFFALWYSGISTAQSWILFFLRCSCVSASMHMPVVACHVVMMTWAHVSVSEPPLASDWDTF